jgi:GxxExxY protein
MPELLYKQLIYDIIGCAMEVHNELGYGFLEKVYENALMLEPSNSQISAIQQCEIKVKYKNSIVGDYVADIIVDNKIILELKAVNNLADEHIAQTLNYLKATGYKLGLLINFGKERLEYKRLIF